mgnify:CR=1 FL=1
MRIKRLPNICDGRQPLGSTEEGVELSVLEGGQSYLPSIRVPVDRQGRDQWHQAQQPCLVERKIPWGLMLLMGLTVIVVGAMLWEMRTSEFQARKLSTMARKLSTSVSSGSSPAIIYPSFGPYDKRMG